MIHQTLTDDLREQLNMFVLGLLPEDETSEMENHVAGGCATCRSEISEIEECLVVLAESVPPAEPSPALRDRILAAVNPPAASQVWKQWSDAPLADLHIVRRDEGEWQHVAPGVSARQLYVDRIRDSVTMLIRMEPGATYEPHRHGGPEQCLVLEGDLSDGVNEFGAGDFQVAAHASVHGVQSTKDGCLLFIVSSLHDELLPRPD